MNSRSLSQKNIVFSLILLPALIAIALSSGCANPWSKTEEATVTNEQKSTLKLTATTDTKFFKKDDALRTRWTVDLKDRRIKDMWLAPHPDEFRTPYEFFLITTDKHDLIAFDEKTGRAQWWTRLSNKITGAPFYTEYAVYVICNSFVISIDRYTGNILWRVELPFPCSTGPTVFEYKRDDPIVYAGSLNQRIAALTIEKKTWPPKRGTSAGLTQKEFVIQKRFPHPAWRFFAHGQVAPTLALRRGTLVGTDSSGFIYGLSGAASLTGKPGKVWKYATRAAILSSPIISGTNVYATSTDKNIYALYRKDGKLLWKYATGNRLTTPAQVVSDPNIRKRYVLAKAGKGPLVALNSTGPRTGNGGAKLPLWTARKGLKVVARINVEDRPKEERCLIVVANSDNTLSGIRISAKDKRSKLQIEADDMKSVAMPAPEAWRLDAKKFGVFCSNTRTQFIYTAANGGRVLCALELQ